MGLWTCGIDDCNARFENVEEAIVHQTTEHDRHECKVCGTVVPEGYFAIRHAFDEHTRAEYVRAYDADSAAVRVREAVQSEIEEEADLRAVVERINELEGRERASNEAPEGEAETGTGTGTEPGGAN